MEKENCVSIWVGFSPSKDVIDEYIHIKYSEDGDQLGSIFSQAYEIEIDGFIDDDFLELSYFEPVSNILNGMECSYFEYISEQIKKSGKQFLDKKVNFSILYYNYDYSGEVNTIKNGDVSVEFLGSFSYQ